MVDTPIHINKSKTHRQALEQVDIHFAGDSGDGMQVLGTRFSEASALQGNDIRTLPDYPAEIRAPQGTIAGVSGFQISFSNHRLYGPGDKVDVLVAMNPAALKSSIGLLKKGGILILDSDKMSKKDLQKAHFEQNPLETDELQAYRIISLALTSLTLKSLESLDISRSKARKCKNMYILGVIYWLYERSLEPTKKWISEKFIQDPSIAEANLRALKSGYNYALTTELFSESYKVEPADLPVGTYKQITGNQAMVQGCLSVAVQNNQSLFMAGYPITPASDILHELSRYPHLGVKLFQAEDEMAAIGSAVGAAFGGELALTATSGPGMDLISETLGLAVMCELPVVVINVQRAGPSTGMPTKVEQSDLMQAIYGRHGEAPIPVLAAKSPGDCFYMARLAFKIAVKYMTPVIVLSDASIANSAEPWKIPETRDLESDRVEIHYLQSQEDFKPYQRNPNTLARNWAIPGTPLLEHCIGGLEKQDITGHISYDPQNHENMVTLRKQKIQSITNDLPPLEIHAGDNAKYLVISWGSNYGVCRRVIDTINQKSPTFAYCHLQSLFPFQAELQEIIHEFDKVFVVELNQGQLCQLIRAEYLVDAKPITKVQGKPLQIAELMNRLLEQVSECP